MSGEWRAANDGSGARKWFLLRETERGTEYLWTSVGIRRPTAERLIRFGSYEAAQRRADQLNRQL